MRKLTLQEFQEKINLAHPKENLVIIDNEYLGRTKPLTVKCNTCGSIYTKKGYNFTGARKVSICKKCFPTQPNTIKTNWQPPQDIQLIEEYKGMHNKILVRHNCGFCWSITPSNLQLGKSCPKCSKKVSKGEQKIINFLKRHNIEYEFQYPIKIKEHNLKIDFYIPKYNLFIEYNGIQHYEPVAHFGGEEKLLKQQEYDNLKQEYYRNNLLIISYLDFDRIEEILLLKFNDHPERE